MKIIRPLNLIFIGFCVWFGGMTTTNFNKLLLGNSQLLLATISLILVAAAGYVWNDFCDLEIDKINRPLRILPRNLISQNEALIWAVILAFSGIAMSFLLSEFYAKLLIGFSTILLFFYSKWLKKKFLVGNLAIGILTGSSFILGEVTLIGVIQFSTIPAIFAFLFNLAREILKDLEDLEGDSIGKRQTVPKKYSIQTAQKIIALILSLIILFSFLPYFLNSYSKIYLISIFITVDLVLAKWILDLLKNAKLDFSKMQRMMKLDMLFVIFSIWLGKVW
ncbi:MAG: hypothetical protein DWQ06_06250 [Calditrichaeota bacterium]|nr:MAG: hypothetical protein DWQ06_06250 [Calditrichota bacterium]